MAGDLSGPANTVTSNFWPAVQALFGGEGVGSLDDLISKLGRIWDAASGAIESLSGQLADKIFQFFMGGGAEETLGDTIGYLVGMFTFQAILDYFTVGASTAIPIISDIARFLHWPMAALEEVMGLLKTLGGYI